MIVKSLSPFPADSGLLLSVSKHPGCPGVSVASVILLQLIEIGMFSHDKAVEKVLWTLFRLGVIYCCWITHHLRSGNNAVIILSNPMV